MIMVTDYEDNLELTAVRTRFNAASTLRLLQNDYTPVPDSALANFTEATFPGYAEVDLAGEWGALTEDANGKWSITANPQTFTRSGVGADNVIYGFYVLDATEVMFAERFATPVIVNATALPFRLTIKYTLESKAVL